MTLARELLQANGYRVPPVIRSIGDELLLVAGIVSKPRTLCATNGCNKPRYTCNANGKPKTRTYCRDCLNEQQKARYTEKKLEKLCSL